MYKRKFFCLFLCLLVISCFSITSFGAVKSYTKKVTTLVSVLDGGTFPIEIHMSSKHTYTDTSTKRKFTRQDYSLMADSSSSSYFKEKVKVTMGILQYFPGGTRCPQNPKFRGEYYVDPDWINFWATISTTTKSFELNSDAYCKLGWMAGGADVVMTKSGTAKWAGIAKK